MSEQALTERPALVLPSGAKVRELDYNHWNIPNDLPGVTNEYMAQLPPVSSTIPALDDLLGGGYRPGLHVWGGASGAGKTALMLYMAERMSAGELGDPVGVTFISLELPAFEVYSRLCSRLAEARDGLDSFPWGHTDEMGWEANKGGAEYAWEEDPFNMALNALSVECGGTLRIVDGSSDARRTKIDLIKMEIEAAGRHGGRVVFIDYLQLIDTGSDDEMTQLRQAVTELRAVAIRSNVVVIAVSALNRENVKGAKNLDAGDLMEKPSDYDLMTSFRGSSCIEYGAVTACVLLRAKPGAEELRNPKWVVDVARLCKNRRGVTGGVQMTYDGEHGQFHGIKIDEAMDYETGAQAVTVIS